MLINDTLEYLLSLQKTIENKRRPESVPDNRHMRMNIQLSCSEDYKFTMFTRSLITFPEDFTVGLRLDAPNPYFSSTVVLVRFQGPHGGQMESDHSIHNSYHIHLYTESDFAHQKNKASYRESTDKFNSIEGAIVEFLKFCNIQDPYGIFNEERNRINQIQFPNLI